MDNILNNVKIFREKNGLELIYTKIPFLQSCTISVMIKTGSVYETKSLRGGAHLLEHLLFKGNKQYESQLELSKKLESMGAQYNAYTDSNMVSFHVKVQKDYLNDTITILGNMIANSLLRDKDIKEEKLVVIQELEKDKDLPAKYVYELINEILYKGTRYSRPIGGNKDTVRDITDKEIHSFWKSNYNSKNIVISIAGNIEIVDLRNHLSSSPFLNGDLPEGVNNSYKVPYKLQNNIRYNYEIREKMNQVQLCVAFPTFNYRDPRKYALDVLKVILAGPMSSRLFIAIRNTYGLGYNVSSHANTNNIYGDLIISTGVDGSELFTNELNLDNKKKADPIKVILEEIFNLCKKKVSLEELNLSKDYIKGNVILESEDTENISQFYGKQRVVGEKVITLQRYIDHIEDITINDLYKLAKEIFKPEHLNISMVGNLDKKKMKNDMSQLVERYHNFIKE